MKFLFRYRPDTIRDKYWHYFIFVSEMVSSSRNPLSLFQYGDEPLKHRYVDGQTRLAFTLEEFQHNDDPNSVIRLLRDTAWVQQHPTILGPDRSYFYLGPNNSMGYLIYGGGNIRLPMPYMLRPGKKEGSISRYWRGQNGIHYKWKVTTHRMECLDNGGTIAVWEVSPPDKEYYAKLTLFPRAMPRITELMTTLVLNQMALGLTWPLSQAG